MTLSRVSIPSVRPRRAVHRDGVGATAAPPVPLERRVQSESSNPLDASACLRCMLPRDAATASDDFNEFGYAGGCYPPDVLGLCRGEACPGR